MFVYLDNSATTRQYERVTEVMKTSMEENYGNPSSLHKLGLVAEKQMRQSRKTVADSLGAKEDEVFFTSGGTESDNTALFGIAHARKRAGKKIITTQVEHPAVLESCRLLEQQGFQVEYIGVDDKCRLDMEQLRAAIDSDTILISIMAVNNETGTIMPVSEIAKIKANALLHSDAVQAYGKISLEHTGADLISVRTSGPGAGYQNKQPGGWCLQRAQRVIFGNSRRGAAAYAGAGRYLCVHGFGMFLQQKRTQPCAFCHGAF